MVISKQFDKELSPAFKFKVRRNYTKIDIKEVME